MCTKWLLASLCQSFYDWPPPLLSFSTKPFSVLLICFSILPKAVLYLWQTYLNVCCHWVNLKFHSQSEIMSAHNRHVVHCSVVRTGAFSEGDIEEHGSVKRCHQQSPMPCWQDLGNSSGYWGYGLRIITPKEDRALLRIVMGSRYLTTSRIRMGLIMQTWFSVYVGKIQRC